MILISCVDDSVGRSFNNRRQSKDRVLTAHIIKRVGENLAWTTGYTAKMLFGNDLGRPLNWKLSNIPLRAAIDGEFCFAEDIPSSEIVYAMQHHGIEAVWLYRWNRSYPGDNFFPLDMTAPPWKKVSETELKGHSHPSILEEIYEAVC